MPRPPKKVIASVDEFLSWLENTDRKHIDGVLRFVASWPFAEELEEVGYQPSVPLMGWKEFQNIEQLMVAMESREDIEYLVSRIMREGEEEEEE